MAVSRVFKEVPQLVSKQKKNYFGDVNDLVETLSRGAITHSAKKDDVTTISQEMIEALRDPDALMAHRTAVGSNVLESCVDGGSRAVPGEAARRGVPIAVGGDDETDRVERGGRVGTVLQRDAWTRQRGGDDENRERSR